MKVFGKRITHVYLLLLLLLLVSETSRAHPISKLAPYIEPLAWRALTAGRGSTIVLSCNVIAGFPVPSARWVFITPNLDTKVLMRDQSASKLELVLKNITKKQEGSYQCIVENEVASDSIRVSLKVV